MTPLCVLEKNFTVALMLLLLGACAIIRTYEKRLARSFDYYGCLNDTYATLCL